ncbi:hypothetical protein K227x_25540 [Rubripirellula lacrimiformis]|uniref:Uncharacterized protein n=1 Tax=Rubripirellula lacrimiformis TaxID=1930273 RepID=A0A517NAK6_9BACT|nr:hypothetical protein [Rubripirellula lacrimiformis]QDT04165.1 hypothetical protein K227x_25540 [Rubripirellula lacrimiformis]
MSASRTLVAACFLLAIPLGFAQASPADDPFGGGGSPDPFFSPPPPTVKSAADTGHPSVRPARNRNRSSAHPGQPAYPKAESIPVDAAATHEAIRKALGSRDSVSIVDMPLNDAVVSLSAQFDVPIVIDSRSLEEIGLSPEEPVNVQLSNVSLRSILKLMLREYELTYVIRDEVLMVTTIEAAEHSLTVRAYRLPEAILSYDQPFMEALKNSVVSDTWDTLGGPSTATMVGPVLVVSTTESVHEDVIALIAKIDAALQAKQ